MTAEEARAKLGKPALKDVDQEFYIFTDNESTQIAYDADHRVVTISTVHRGNRSAGLQGCRGRR